ncbi:PH domain-containing protein [Cellulomonas fimi]|uniref:PH domain-containing protein n=1 Tax=Cellulomonas fimi TaxID=1708 RepID=UPI00234D9B67|nr:PH domain-containing protein [Cellulomonas fimi]MDC7123651.1 PH domain-containing protein [Cellulomonas fimi]
MSGTTAPPAVEWRRMHPVTPALKGWKIVVAVLVVVGYQAADDVRRLLELVEGYRWLVVLGGLAAVAVVGFAYSALAWRMTRFAVTDDAVHLNTGILFRQQRQARLDRLQAVDVVQPLLARLVGLAELKLEVAGGSGSGVSLAFLRESDALALRAELLALAAGLQRPGMTPTAASRAPEALDGRVDGAGGDGADGTAPGVDASRSVVAFEAAPEHQVYEVPMSRLVLATLRSGATVGLVLAAVVALAAGVLSRTFATVFFLLPMFFGLVSYVWSRINQGASFRAATSPDGIRLRHGLTESRAQTVPPGRVQAIRISQGMWWRRPDWWRVEMNVAGYSPSGEQQRDTVLHPVATRDEVRTALWLVLHDLGVDDPVAVVDAALTGTDESHGFAVAPRRARWVDPLGWRRHGVLVTQRALVIRRGRWWRQVDVVPHERTQSLGLQQGPLQRRLGLASFVVHSTPGPVSPDIAHLDAGVVVALLDEQSERARTARASEGPEQWMRKTAAPVVVAGQVGAAEPAPPGSPVTPDVPHGHVGDPQATAASDEAVFAGERADAGEPVTRGPEAQTARTEPGAGA